MLIPNIYFFLIKVIFFRRLEGYLIPKKRCQYAFRCPNYLTLHEPSNKHKKGCGRVEGYELISHISSFVLSLNKGVAWWYLPSYCWKRFWHLFKHLLFKTCLTKSICFLFHKFVFNNEELCIRCHVDCGSFSRRREG